MTRTFFAPAFLGAALLVLVHAVGAANAPALAHAVAVKGTLQDSQPIADRAQTVEIRFNSAVEPDFIQVFLRHADGRETALPARPGGSRDRIMVDLPALAAGPYVLRYRVLAADGHFTENALRFRVAPEGAPGNGVPDAMTR